MPGVRTAHEKRTGVLVTWLVNALVAVLARGQTAKQIFEGKKTAVLHRDP
jgi:hypothetical protein